MGADGSCVLGHTEPNFILNKTHRVYHEGLMGARIGPFIFGPPIFAPIMKRTVSLKVLGLDSLGVCSAARWGAFSGPLIMSDQTHRFNAPRGALASFAWQIAARPLISSSITKTSNFPSKITLLPPNDQNYSNAPEFYKYLKILIYTIKSHDNARESNKRERK